MRTLIEISTRKKVPEADFRQQMKHVSFPANLTDDMLKKYGYAILEETPKPDMGEFKTAVEDGMEEVDGKWKTRWKEAARSYSEIISTHPRILELKAELELIDKKSIRPLRKLVLRRGDQADADYLEKLDIRRDALANELKILIEAAKMVAKV